MIFLYMGDSERDPNSNSLRLKKSAEIKQSYLRVVSKMRSSSWDSIAGEFDGDEVQQRKKDASAPLQYVH